MAKQQRKVHLLRSLEEDATKAGERTSAVPAVRKVPSLLFDIELEDTVPEELLDEEVGDIAEQLHALTKPRTPLEKQLTERVLRIHKENAVEGGTKLEASFLATKLCYPGYVFKIRTALGGSCAGSCLRQLRHFFLTCSSKEDLETVCCVIDPLFREQFEIANPTKRYAKLLAELPPEIVLTEERLASLVNLLSNEMKQSFQATGTTLPPWRHSSSLMSKWRPRRSEDVVVQPFSSGSKSTDERSHSESKAGKVIVPKLEAFDGSHEKSNRDCEDSRGHRSKPSDGSGLMSSSQLETPLGSGTKRSRDLGPSSSTYSSLLAAKLRGVTAFDCGARVPTAMYPNKGQA